MQNLLPNNSQSHRVLRVLLEAGQCGVSKRYLVQDMMLSQAGARVKELEDSCGWKGYIQHGPEKDEYGFKILRITAIPETLTCPVCLRLADEADTRREREAAQQAMFSLKPVEPVAKPERLI